jgi:integrase
MVDAAPPAQPGHPTPRLRPLPAATPDGSRTPTTPTTTARAGAAPGVTGATGTRDTDSPFARLTAPGTFRVPAPAHDHPNGAGAGAGADWHDPDPEAGLALGAGHTPYDRALHRWKEGTSRDNAVSGFRVTLRILTGNLDLAADDEELRAYPWHQVSVEDAADFHRAVYRRYGNQATRNDKVGKLRQVLAECAKTRLISTVRREELMETLYTMAPGRSTRRHRITDDEFDTLLAACLDTGGPFARARNSAIVALFRTTGLRVSELVKLDLADWDRREDTLTLRDTKNRDPHILFLHAGTKALLLNWLEIRGDTPGKLFTGLHRPLDVALAPVGVPFMLTSRCRAAGIAPFGTHDFRRTFATEMLRRYDAALVSKLMNLRKLSSTLIYDMSSDDEMRDAVGSIDLPGPRIGGAA